MKKHRKRVLAIAALGVATVLPGLGGPSISGAQADTPGNAPYCTENTSGVTAAGGGATFLNNAMNATVAAGFAADGIIETHKDNCVAVGVAAQGTVTYNGGLGSGGGRTGTCNATLDFGGSEEPFSASAKASCELSNPGRGAINHFPVALGAVTVSFNPPVNCSAPSPARFAGREVGRIFASVAAADDWDDLVDFTGDPDCTGPITRVVRSNSSGTTFVFKDYLCKADPNPGGAADWCTLKGQNTTWPAGNVATATFSSNDLMADHIAATPGTIGYIELSVAEAKNLTYAEIARPQGDVVFNAAGQKPAPLYASPRLPNGSANCVPASNTVVLPTSTQADWSTTSMTYDQAGYPICSFSYVVVFTNFDADSGVEAADDKEQLIHDLISTANLASTQARLAQLGYGPLPPAAIALNQAGLAQLG